MAGVAGALTLTGALSSCFGPAATPLATPTPTAALKGGRVKVWVVPGSPAEETFYQNQLGKFASTNPDITLEIQSFPAAQYANALQLAFTGGTDIPDVFKQASGQGVTAFSANQKGWIQPVTQFLTPEYIKPFPEYVFDPKQSPLYIDGEAYGVPSADPKVNAVRMLYYNEELLSKAGFDSAPKTWSEMSRMAEKITKDAKGSAYGFGIVGKAGATQILQNLAGPQAFRYDAEPPISLLTGKPAMSDPSMKAMVEYLQGLNSKGVIAPGWETWDPAQALQQMAAGRLGMYIFPTFHAAELRKLNPDLALGLATPPSPDNGRQGSRAPVDNIVPWWMMSSEAASPDAAWRVMEFLSSIPLQRALYEELGEVSIIPEVFDEVTLSSDTIAIRKAAADVVRTRPDPVKRNPKAYDFYADLVAEGPKPAPLDQYRDVISKGTDFAPVAKQYDTQLSAVVRKLEDRHGISAEDAFAFPDWDPLVDYTK